MNMVAAVLAGLAGTVIFSMVLTPAPRMGMPKMDIVGTLSTMFGTQKRQMGWAMHFMMGILFALVYALLWSKGILGPTVLGGIIFGTADWIIAGMIMGMLPLIHQGIRRGDVQAPGLWMTNNGGMPAFAGGLAGHLLFGIVTALIYALLR
jgi:uncharacterized membrane protein YagU involved in acid resistance